MGVVRARRRRNGLFRIRVRPCARKRPRLAQCLFLAAATGTSACWIQFGLGPIRSGERDLQAVRHQNLVYLYREAVESPSVMSDFVVGLQLSARQVVDHVDNPFQHIGERLARRIEKAGARPRSWLDEQQVESDGLCRSFPDDLRELMTIYSEMDGKSKRMLMSLARTMVAEIT